VKQGRVTRIEGGHEARVFQRWLESFGYPAMFQVDHACYDFHPGATRPCGRILEDERLFGCMQFGIGPTSLGAPSHTDGVVLDPTVYLDETMIEEAGRYIHPESVALCREMEVPAY
jgi:leucyl aminopeptidase (aminopeptidase T)